LTLVEALLGMAHVRNVVADLISKKRKLDRTSSLPDQDPTNTQDSHPDKLIKVNKTSSTSNIVKIKQVEDPSTLTTDKTKHVKNNQVENPSTLTADKTKQDEKDQAKDVEAELQQESENARRGMCQTAKTTVESKTEQERSEKAKFDAADKHFSKDQASSMEYSCECMKFFIVRINQLLSILSQIVSSKSYAYQIKVCLARTKFNSEFCNVPDTVRSVWNMSDQQKQKAQSYMAIWHKAASTKVQERQYAVHDVLSNESVPALDAVNIIVDHIPVLKTVGLDEMALNFETANLVVLRKLLVSLCALVMHTK
jgi:hypothetical protein